MFTLLQELEDIKQIDILEESIKLYEDVGKFLQPIVARIKDAVETDKNPFKEPNTFNVNKEQLASILTGLQTLANADERAGHNVLGSDRLFYIFLSSLGEKNQNAVKAENHLKNAFKNNPTYKTYYENNLKALEMLEQPTKDDDIKDKKQKFADKVAKLSSVLQSQMNKLKATIAAKKTDTDAKEEPA